MSSNKSIENQLIKKKEKIDQITAEYKQLQKLQRAEERKEQEKRAAKRGVLLEKLLPGTAILGDTDFKIFLERTIANESVKSALAASIAKQVKPNATEVKTTPAQNSNPPEIKTVAVSQTDDEESEDYEGYT